MTQPLSSIRYRGLIAPEEVPTGDRRMFARGSLSHRRLPNPVMFTRVRGQRHDGGVTVASLQDIQYAPGRGWVGEGAFLDPQIVPEVVEAVYLVSNGLSSPSVDLQPDVTFEVVPDPRRPGEGMARVLVGRIMGFTFVPFPAFEEVEISVSRETDQAILASAGITLPTSFAVDGTSWRSMPIAERDTIFAFREAMERILEWSGGTPARFKRAFLYQDTSSNEFDQTSYHLPIADVIDGKLTMIPRAVFSAATFMAGGHGGLPNISEREQEQIRRVIGDIYDALRARYGDPRIRTPWDRE